MNFRLVFADRNNTKSANCVKKHPDLQTLQLMELDIHLPFLRLHKRSGSLSDLSSVSIDMSYRITLELIIQDRDVILITIGSYDDVYC